MAKLWRRDEHQALAPPLRLLVTDGRAKDAFGAGLGARLAARSMYAMRQEPTAARARIRKLYQKIGEEVRGALRERE